MEKELLHLLLSFRCNFLTFIFRVSCILEPCTVHLHEGELDTLGVLSLWLFYLYKYSCPRSCSSMPSTHGSCVAGPESSAPGILSWSRTWQCLLDAPSLRGDAVQLGTIPHVRIHRHDAASGPTGCWGGCQQIPLLYNQDTAILEAIKNIFNPSAGTCFQHLTSLIPPSNST